MLIRYYNDHATTFTDLDDTFWLPYMQQRFLDITHEEAKEQITIIKDVAPQNNQGNKRKKKEAEEVKIEVVTGSGVKSFTIVPKFEANPAQKGKPAAGKKGKK